MSLLLQASPTVRSAQVPCVAYGPRSWLRLLVTFDACAAKCNEDELDRLLADVDEQLPAGQSSSKVRSAASAQFCALLGWAMALSITCFVLSVVLQGLARPYTRAFAQTMELLETSEPRTIDQMAREVFPGDVYHYAKKWNPHFAHFDIHASPDCGLPHPSIYFSNPQAASEVVFHNHYSVVPMAMTYMNTSSWARPPPGQKQTVIGFVEMQWPYYQYLGQDLEHTSWPYLVLSMGGGVWSPELNSKFTECALLGWPGLPYLEAGKWPLRVIVKNEHFGHECFGDRAGKGECNLATSWGRPQENFWRPTAMEVNELVQLCTFKYRCEIQKAKLLAPPEKEAPQIFLMRVLRGQSGMPLRPDTTTTTTRTATGATTSAAQRFADIRILEQPD